MKTMASATFFLLALALVSVPLRTEAKEEAPEGDLCVRVCEDRKEPEHTVCRESCAINQRASEVLFQKFACNDKCAAQKGIAPPALKACEEGCNREYAAKAAVITADCNKACGKSKLPPSYIELCKTTCTSSLH